MVCVTTVIGLSFLVGAIALGLSLDNRHALEWMLWTFIMLIAHLAVAEPLKIYVLAMYWAKSRKNVPK